MGECMCLSNSSAIGWNLALRVTPGAKAPETAAAPMVEQALRQDAARGITRAQKQHVVGVICHGDLSMKARPAS